MTWITLCLTGLPMLKKDYQDLFDRMENGGVDGVVPHSQGDWC